MPGRLSRRSMPTTHTIVSVSRHLTIGDPLVTVWPAFTEAMYFLRSWWEGQSALLEMVETETLRFASLDETDVPRMKALMRQYRDLPMDLADAGLVRIAEREKLSRIFTLDRRRFRVYRPAGVGKILYSAFLTGDQRPLPKAIIPLPHQPKPR